MNKREESLHKLFQDHRVIFWYDADAKMRDQYEEVQLDAIQKVEVNNNEFSIKYKILKEAPEAKFLLYFPYGEKPHEENWLLDLQLAFREFHTDQEAMYLQELGLDYYFKELVSDHIEFFHSKERKAKLKEQLAEGDSDKDIRFKMMTVLFNTDFPALETFIQSYATHYIDGNDKIERDLERFNLDKIFWKMVSRKFDYHSETPSIYDFLLDVFSRNFSLTNKGRSVTESRILLSFWKDTISHQDAFRSLSDKMIDDLKVEDILGNASLEEVYEDDLFRIIDKKIIHELVSRLEHGSITLTNLLKVIKNRENKYWYSEFKDLYASLENGAQMMDLVQKIGKLQVLSIEAAATQYADKLFLVDYHYRKFIYHYRRAGQNRILHQLYQKVEKVYSNDWLLGANTIWQDHLNQVENWINASRKAQSNFFNIHVKPVISIPQRLFVVISDAMRYEIGWELCKEIQSENRYEAELDHMITGLPSYTQLGMAALLPHKQLEIHSKDCSVLADGISSVGIQGRTKVLQTNSGVRAVAINAEEFMKMDSKTEGRPFVKEYDLIYIYHNQIDKTGDDKTSEDKVFEAVEDEIVFLKELLKKIANVNGTNIYITSDHGYIYQHEVLNESEFSVAEVAGDKWKVNRRFVIGKNLESNNAVKKFTGDQLGLASDMDVLVTKGINRLRVSGAGSRFVHGGASLQEIVVPLLKVTKKRKDDITQVDVDIIKSTDKITTNILAVSFLQKELVTDKILPRQLRAYLKAKDDAVISDKFTYTFDASEGSERQREVKHRFQLSSQASGKYKNQRVSLILEEPVEGSSKWKRYEEYFYTLNVSFTNDFDDF